MDLGCGDGVLGKTLFVNWPDSKGLFIDYSEPMTKAARSNCKEYQEQAVFMIKDFGKTD